MSPFTYLCTDPLQRSSSIRESRPGTTGMYDIRNLKNFNFYEKVFIKRYFWLLIPLSHSNVWIKSRIFQTINQNRSDESLCEPMHESGLNQKFHQKISDFWKLSFLHSVKVQAYFECLSKSTLIFDSQLKISTWNVIVWRKNTDGLQLYNLNV